MGKKKKEEYDFKTLFIIKFSYSNSEWEGSFLVMSKQQMPNSLAKTSKYFKNHYKSQVRDQTRKEYKT